MPTHCEGGGGSDATSGTTYFGAFPQWMLLFSFHITDTRHRGFCQHVQGGGCPSLQHVPVTAREGCQK